MSRHILFDNMYASPLDRQALADGICVHSPFHFSDVTRQATEFGGYRKIVTQCSPMDKNGYLSAGVSGNFLDAANNVDELIMEVNEHQPRIHGRNFYHILQVAAVIENHHPLRSSPRAGRRDRQADRREHRLVHRGRQRHPAGYRRPAQRGGRVPGGARQARPGMLYRNDPRRHHVAIRGGSDQQLQEELLSLPDERLLLGGLQCPLPVAQRKPDDLLHAHQRQQ